MTNKEKIVKSMNKDFDKENNYNKIIEKIEKGKNMKTNKNIWKWTLVPIGLILIIGGLSLINFKKDNVTLENYIDKENNIKLYINDLNKMGVSVLRMDADIKKIPSNGINIPWLDILKGGISIPEDLNRFNGYSIYTRKDKTSEYNILNCYVYNYTNQNDEDYRNIRIAFQDTNKPIRDYFFSDENSEETIINNQKLKIYKYEKIYFIEFKYRGYNFDIETSGITKQELSNLLVSIIK